LQIDTNVSKELAATLQSLNELPGKHGPIMLYVLPCLAITVDKDPVTAIKAYGGVELQHHSFSSSAIEDE
jgi:hypothetical protein